MKKYKIVERFVHSLFPSSKEETKLAEFNNYYICWLYRYFYCFGWEPGPRGTWKVEIEENVKN